MKPYAIFSRAQTALQRDKSFQENMVTSLEAVLLNTFGAQDDAQQINPTMIKEVEQLLRWINQQYMTGAMPNDSKDITLGHLRNVLKRVKLELSHTNVTLEYFKPTYVVAHVDGTEQFTDTHEMESYIQKDVDDLNITSQSDLDTHMEDYKVFLSLGQMAVTGTLEVEDIEANEGSSDRGVYRVYLGDEQYGDYTTRSQATDAVIGMMNDEGYGLDEISMLYVEETTYDLEITDVSVKVEVE